MARTFGTEAFATLHVPHPDPRYTPFLVPADYYCAPGRQRSGHIERLEQQESRSTLNPTWQVAQNNWDRLDDVRKYESDTHDAFLTFGCQETFIYAFLGGL